MLASAAASALREAADAAEAPAPAAAAAAKRPTFAAVLVALGMEEGFEEG